MTVQISQGCWQSMVNVDGRTYFGLGLTKIEAKENVLAQLNAHIERLQEAAAKLKGETPHQPEPTAA